MTSPHGVVLVAGPPLSGVDRLVEALRAQLPDALVVGSDGPPPDRAPDAVLAVLSAVAPVTRSDWALIERAAAGTDLVVGVVSKIDSHRTWRDVMEADRVLVAHWDDRGESMPWVGVAAAPDLGGPHLGDVVALLRQRLANPGLDHRNRLRRSNVRPSAGVSTIELRSVLQRTRLRLLRFVRDRCSELRAELRDTASAVPVGGAAVFETLVATEADRFVVELDEEIGRALRAAASELGLVDRAVTPLEPAPGQNPPDVSRSSSSRRLEGRLMAVLGVGFGMGIALASSRLLAGLAPGLSIVGLAAGAAVGLALVVWVVRVRGLLHDRAMLDRWVTDVGATLRWHGEAAVAERLLIAESEWAIAVGIARPRRASTQVSKLACGDPTHGLRDVTDQYEW